ncbi:MAG: trypsin-like peptidase domain-containing protein, partial [Desulfovibrionaceae bacterium]|nr:trypsin-like peptidase domain-containing protein [Desulfovibrionaceae bacterium]
MNRLVSILKIPAGLILVLLLASPATASVSDLAEAIRALPGKLNTADVAELAEALKKLPKEVHAALIPRADFRDLVKEVGPAVVNVSTERAPRSRGRSFSPFPFPFDEDFDFFFPFGRPGPGMPPQERRQSSLGSGFIISEDGYIVTNNHVVEGAEVIRVNFDSSKNKDTSFEAEVIGVDKETDLALLKIESSTKLPFIKFGDSDALEVGETVVAIGNAIGEGKSATAGIVSALNKEINIDGVRYNAIQTDATINPGNSGGALVNTSSEVIGINTAKISGNGVEGMGYSIPSNTAKRVIDQIMTNGSPKKPYLGVEGGTITEDMLARNLFLPGLGAYIQNVYQGSAAAKGGLKPNDIIVGINGEEIKSFEELTEAILEIGVGGTAVLDVFRMDNNRTFNMISV